MRCAVPSAPSTFRRSPKMYSRPRFTDFAGDQIRLAWAVSPPARPLSGLARCVLEGGVGCGQVERHDPREVVGAAHRQIPREQGIQRAVRGEERHCARSEIPEAMPLAQPCPADAFQSRKSRSPTPTRPLNRRPHPRAEALETSDCPSHRSSYTDSRERTGACIRTAAAGHLRVPERIGLLRRRPRRGRDR